MKRPRLDVNLGELDQLLDQAREVPLSEPGCNKLKTTLHALGGVTERFADWPFSREFRIRRETQ